MLRSTLPDLERCCLGSFGILGVLGFRVGCLSALGTCPLSGSLNLGAHFPLSLSEPEREDKEFLLVEEEEDDELDEDNEEDEDED